MKTHDMRNRAECSITMSIHQELFYENRYFKRTRSF